MGKDTVIVLSDGSQYKLTPKAIEFVESLKAFCAKKGIPEEKIPQILAELARRESNQILAELARREQAGE